jgi:hypothetical protein
MTVANLIIGDSLFAIVLILIFATGGLNENAIILIPLLVIAFARCAIRHINHYKETGRIY